QKRQLVQQVEDPHAQRDVCQFVNESLHQIPVRVGPQPVERNEARVRQPANQRVIDEDHVLKQSQVKARSLVHEVQIRGPHDGDVADGLDELVWKLHQRVL